MGNEDCYDSKMIHEKVTEQRAWEPFFDASASIKHPSVDVLSADSTLSFPPLNVPCPVLGEGSHGL